MSSERRNSGRRTPCLISRFSAVSEGNVKMFKKTALVISALSMIAVPGVADAHHYRGYYGSYDQGDDERYYEQQQGYYQQPAYGYDNGYYGAGYRYPRHRCSGTTGAIIGAGAGALLGRSMGRGSGYYHQHSGTTGAIIGAALGALAGREVGRSTC